MAPACARRALILVCEDDPEDRETIRAALESEDGACEVQFVSDGEALLEFLGCGDSTSDSGSRSLPSLILLDLNLPRVDGRQVLPRLKASERLRRIPLVVLTGSENEEDVLEAYDQGANSFLTKPVHPEELTAMLQSVVSYWLEIVELPSTD